MSARLPFATPDEPVIILIDGQRAEILFAGLAPGSIGLLQVNARIPEGITPSPNVMVGARIGTAGLQEGMRIAVKAAPQTDPLP